MKQLFASALVVLLLASVALRLSYPDVSSDRPVLYWITGTNAARVEQVAAFERWLVENGHTAADGGPAFELRLDAANKDMTKKIIQSVSGVGADVMDLYSGVNMRLMADMGVVSPIEEPAARLGFSLADTYAVLEPELAVGGHQYMYPCNVTVRTLIVNPAAFAAAGQPQPPQRWTIEEFERAGKAWVAAANTPETPAADRKFFIDALEVPMLWRSFGASRWNETCTASGFDTGGYRKALETWKRWIYEEHLLPTPDDMAAFATTGSAGAASLQLFARGNYAMLTGGRHYLLRLRGLPSMRNLRAIEAPHGGFPNTLVDTRAASVYAGGKHPELAHLFLAFLASDEYNALIVRDADALPPNPAALRTEAYLRPPAYPDEWDFHGPIAQAALDIGVGGSYSPFLQPTELARERDHFQALYELGRITLDEAVARTHAAVNRGVQATLDRKPQLLPEYDRRLAIQAAVDTRREAGATIPENWIFNAYFRAFYGRTGRVGPSEPFPAGGEPVAADAPTTTPDRP